MEEVWKPVLGFEGLYEISNLCRCKSLPRNRMHCGTVVFYKGMILKPYVSPLGYHYYTLLKNGKPKKMQAHRMLVHAFWGFTELSVNHINANPSDNRLENLELMTRAENSREAQTRRKRERPASFQKKMNYYNIALLAKIMHKFKADDLAELFGVYKGTIEKQKRKIRDKYKEKLL